MSNADVQTAQTPRIQFALVGAGVIDTHAGKVIDELSDRIELVSVADLHLAKRMQTPSHRGGQAVAPLG
mgnify:CR=1 FL=1